MQNSSRFILTCFQMRLEDDAFMCPKFQRVFFPFSVRCSINPKYQDQAQRCDTHRWVCLCGTRCKASQRWMKVLEMKTPSRDLPAYMRIKTGRSDLTWSLRVSTELQTSCSNCTTYFSLLPGPRSASQISLSMGGGCVMLHISTRDPSFSCRLGL